jgi:predicted ferric reductase
LLFALALMGLLWFHVPLKHRQSMICLTVASGVWILQECLWVGRIWYQNFRSHTSKAMSLIQHSSVDGKAEAVDMTLVLKRPWKIQPGQYVYITLPGVSRHHGGFAQSHPYTIAWAEGSEITLLIQRHTGFSNDLFTSSKTAHSSTVVDGPYGHPQLLLDYDKVLFIASGIGIAAHLLAIKSLLEAHENQSARVRRITLIWFLETDGLFCHTNLNTTTDLSRTGRVGQSISTPSPHFRSTTHIYTDTLHNYSYPDQAGAPKL